MISGNANKYCSEDISLIENYSKAINDDTQTWICHHRREISEMKSSEQLKKEGKYFQVPASDLIFMTEYDHRHLHNINMSDETKSKISNTLNGHEVSEETRIKISAANTGKEVPEELRARISATMTGRKQSEEHRRHESEAQQGHIVSEETRERLRQLRLGTKHSEETKRKISIANAGKIRSEEARKNISEGHKLAIQSEEYRKNLSIAVKNSVKNNEKNYYNWYLEKGFIPNKTYTWDELQKLIVYDNGEPYYKATNNFIRMNKDLFEVVGYQVYKFLDRQDLLNI